MFQKQSSLSNNHFLKSAWKKTVQKFFEELWTVFSNQMINPKTAGGDCEGFNPSYGILLCQLSKDL